MKKGFKIRNLIVCLIMGLAVYLVASMEHEVYAASASVNVSSGSGTTGDTISVTVEVKADSKIGAFNFYLEYDETVLEAVSGFEGGGGGRIQLEYEVSDLDNVPKTVSRTVKFKAKKAGTSAIKYVTINGDDGVLDFDTIDNMAISSKDGSITVKAPVAASKNANLASMTVAAVKSDGSSTNVTLSPAFSKDVTTYNLTVEEGVKKLAISAKTEDAKATTNVKWGALDPGDNTTYVTVTAEDGSTKTYTIYTKVPVSETTTKEPEETSKPSESTQINVDGISYFVENIDDSVQLPEGFETTEYEYNGKKLQVGKGLSKNLIVMYLTKGDGSTGQLFIYNETSKTFYPMANVDITPKLYTIIEAPEDLYVPTGFVEDTIEIDGVTAKCWKNAEISNVCLVYAMNWDGKASLYVYDEEEQQIIKYFNFSAEAGASIEVYNSVVAENEQLKAQVEKFESEGGNSGKNLLYKYVAYCAGVAVIVLFGVVIALLAKKSDNEDENDDENDDDIDENAKDSDTENDEDKYAELDVIDINSDRKVVSDEQTSEEENQIDESSLEDDAIEKDDEEFSTEIAADVVELSEEQEEILDGFEDMVMSDEQPKKKKIIGFGKHDMMEEPIKKEEDKSDAIKDDIDLEIDKLFDDIFDDK